MSILSDINLFFIGQIEVDDLKVRLAKVVTEIVEKGDINLFEEYFGKTAAENYLAPAKLNLLETGKKEFTSQDETRKAMHQHMTTVYIQACFYYACYKGCRTVVQYLVEKQHMPGDLDANVETYFKQLPIKGTPLHFATLSGNLALVSYLYEKTAAMIETTYGQPTEKTPLMLACEKGHASVAVYLAQKGANVNAKCATMSESTPIKLAIAAKNTTVVRTLVNAGAIITTAEVIAAIKLALAIDFIHYLMRNCVEKENPNDPYLIAALKGGNIENLNALEANPQIIPFTEIAKFDDKPLAQRMLLAAVSSGSLAMVRHVQLVKQVDVLACINQENEKRNQQLTEANQSSDLQKIGQTCDTLLYAAMESDSQAQQLVMMPLFFAELCAVPSYAVIRDLCTVAHAIKPVAYLFSFLPEHHEQKKMFSDIAFRLEQLSLSSLFKLYNTQFIQEGNALEKHGCNRFDDVVAAIIKEKLAQLSDDDFVNIDDFDEVKGALFYFCNSEYNKDSKALVNLLTQLIRMKKITSVDVQNCQGYSLASYAAKHWSYNIVRLLLIRGADPDLPDNKGATLLTKILDFDYSKNFEWIKLYAKKVTHSLRHASKEWLCSSEVIESLLTHTKGDTQGITTLELVENILAANHGKERKLLALFVHLPESECIRMIQLLRDYAFIQKHKIANYELSSYFQILSRQSNCLLKIKRIDSKKSMLQPMRKVYQKSGPSQPQKQILLKQ